MRLRISIWGYVRPSVRPSDRPSVRNAFSQTPARRILCLVLFETKHAKKSAPYLSRLTHGGEVLISSSRFSILGGLETNEGKKVPCIRHYHAYKMRSALNFHSKLRFIWGRRTSSWWGNLYGHEGEGRNCKPNSKTKIPYVIYPSYRVYLTQCQALRGNVVVLISCARPSRGARKKWSRETCASVRHSRAEQFQRSRKSLPARARWKRAFSPRFCLSSLFISKRIDF